jgi:hypothetical protein
MKIAKLETFTNQYVGFVRVTADTGDTGWGQVSTYHADITCQVFHRQVALVTRWASRHTTSTTCSTASPNASTSSRALTCAVP